MSRDVVTGHILAPACGPTRTESAFLAHLQAVVATHPEATYCHIVCDQLNTYQSESLVRWLVRPQRRSRRQRGERHSGLDEQPGCLSL